MVQSKEGISKAFLPYPSRLYIETTTRCNLSCPYCPRTLTNSAESDISLGLIERLSPALKGAESVVLSGLGEPLLHPEIGEIVRLCRGKMPSGASVGFQTNGSRLDRTVIRRLVDCGLNRLCLSLHELEEPYLSFNIDNILTRLTEYSDYFKEIDFGVEIILTRQNLFYIAKVLEKLDSLGVSFVIISQLLPYDAASLAHCAYDINTQKAVSIYKKWSVRASRQGIDLRDYYGVLRRFYHDQRDRLLLRIVEEMKGEASAEGVNLFLSHLLNRDEEWFDRAEEALQKICQKADNLALLVKAPGLYPSNIRQCEFIESGAYFVNVTGDVSPCYYLWHHCNCYLGGLKKEVRPWVFGNISNGEPLAIWQKGEFMDFRKEVVEYRFPFCFDCSFALCNLVDGADFENDCYISQVPCGACLWCTGLFNCLL
jgi:putative metalloenzyme radical SAM/SPASM domain maturase